MTKNEKSERLKNQRLFQCERSSRGLASSSTNAIASSSGTVTRTSTGSTSCIVVVVVVVIVFLGKFPRTIA